MTPEIPITPEHVSHKRRNPVGRRAFVAFAVMTGGLVAGNHIANPDVTSEPAPSISDADASLELPSINAPLPSFPVAEVYSERDALSPPTAPIESQSEDYSPAATDTVIESTITQGSVIGSGSSEVVQSTVETAPERLVEAAGQSALLDAEVHDELSEAGIYGPATVSVGAVRGGSKTAPTTIVETPTTTTVAETTTTTSEVPTSTSTTTTSSSTTSSSIPRSTTTTTVPETTSTTTTTTAPETTSTTTTTTPETTTTIPELRTLPEALPIPNALRSTLERQAAYSQQLSSYCSSFLIENADGKVVAGLTAEHCGSDDLVPFVDEEGNNSFYIPVLSFGTGERINSLNYITATPTDLYLPIDRQKEDVAIVGFNGADALAAYDSIPRAAPKYGETLYAAMYPHDQDLDSGSGVIERQILSLIYIGEDQNLKISNGDVLRRVYYFASKKNENNATCSPMGSGAPLFDKDGKIAGVHSAWYPISTDASDSEEVKAKINSDRNDLQVKTQTDLKDYDAVCVVAALPSKHSFLKYKIIR